MSLLLFLGIFIGGEAVVIHFQGDKIQELQQVIDEANSDVAFDPFAPIKPIDV